MSKPCLSTWICLLYDIRRLCTLVFNFSDFFNFLRIWIISWSNPRFHQDLDKFNTWKWVSKHGSFLVTLKWSFWDVLEISMFETQNHFSSWLTSIRSTDQFRVRGRYIHDFLVWICLDLVYQLECLLYIWHKNAMCFGFSFSFWIFSKFLGPFESWSNPWFDQDLNKFKTWKWKGKSVSFVVTLKWRSFWDVLVISMFETENEFPSHASRLAS